MACQIVVIARMMVVGADRTTDTVEQRKVVSLLSQQREMLTQRDPRGRCGDGLKRSSVFQRSSRFHVPHVNVRGPAAEKEQNGAASCSGGGA